MVHRTLKLQHHRHTAKRMPHAHTSYRGLFLVLLLSALCFSAVHNVRADDYSVSAVVPSSVLDQPAVITAPANNAVLANSIVQIQGSCQVSLVGTVVVLERDGETLGSQACQSNGRFAITVTLIEGENIVLPKVFTSANVPGPDGQPVRLVWQPVVSAPGQPGGQTAVQSPLSTSSTSRTTGGAPAGPASARPERSFLVYESGESVRLSITMEGGSAPYRLKINWGDQTTIEEWTIQGAGTQNYEHTYKIDNTYAVKISLVDARGQQYETEVTAISLNVPIINFAAPTSPLSGLTAWFSSPITRIVWGGYMLVCVLAIVLWWASPTHSLFWNGHAPGAALFKRRP
jgi:hypothetical protein